MASERQKLMAKKTVIVKVKNNKQSSKPMKGSGVKKGC